MNVVLEHMPSVALGYLEQGQGAALATVISTWGSAPRPVGSQLAIAQNGAFQGSVSGGCVEGAVILEAQAAIADGKCRVLNYGIADENAFAVGLACGGDIRILVEPIGVGSGPEKQLVEAASKATKARKPFAYSVDLNSWERQQIDPEKQQTELSGNVFTQVSTPRLRMMIVGAVHITQSLSPMAKMAGYDVMLIDPRDGFATKERFSDDVFIDEWPDKALENIGLDAHTAVITLSHDPKIDTPALAVALGSDAFYIGALGSRKTHAKRVKQLQDLGFDDVNIARIHSPIGLNIGSQSPAEIAISIIAEVTECLHGKKVRS
jgi:xanthine dehydrogenase accessory factor